VRPREAVSEPRQQKVDGQFQHKARTEFHINLRCKRKPQYR
jgi:hypothetical protein